MEEKLPRARVRSTIDAGLLQRLQAYAADNGISLPAALDRAIWRLLSERPLQSVRVGRHLLYIPSAEETPTDAA